MQMSPLPPTPYYAQFYLCLSLHPAGDAYTPVGLQELLS